MERTEIAEPGGRKDSAGFLFPRRLARLQFLGRYVILLVALVIADVLLQLGEAESSSSLGLSGPVRLSFSIVSCILLIFILVCLFLSILFPRLRDIGLYAGYSLIIFIPFINILFFIALLFMPTATFTEENANAARAWGVISAICAGLFFLALGVMILQSIAGVYDGPLFYVTVFIFTFPISCICTLVALIKVGPRRSKLAWLSLFSYFAVPMLLLAIGKACELIGRSMR